MTPERAQLPFLVLTFLQRVAFGHRPVFRVGAVVGAVATGFATGGLFVPADLAVGYAWVTLPFTATAGGIDIANGVNELGGK